MRHSHKQRCFDDPDQAMPNWFSKPVVLHDPQIGSTIMATYRLHGRHTVFYVKRPVTEETRFMSIAKSCCSQFLTTGIKGCCVQLGRQYPFLVLSSIPSFIPSFIRRSYRSWRTCTGPSVRAHLFPKCQTRLVRSSLRKLLNRYSRQLMEASLSCCEP